MISTKLTKPAWFLICHCHTHNSVNEGDKLLFFLLPLDEMSLNQRLQLCQVLLLTLPADVLPPEKASDIIRNHSVLYCHISSKCQFPLWGLLKHRLTSKSTLSPSGIFGAEIFDMNLWKCTVNYYKSHQKVYIVAQPNRRHLLWLRPCIITRRRKQQHWQKQKEQMSKYK